MSESLLLKIVETRLVNTIEKLAKNGLVECKDRILPTEFGESMSRNYVSLETMMLICQGEKVSSIKDVLEVLSKAKENEKFRSRNEERKTLNQINNSSSIRYKVPGPVNTFDKKCFLLYQAAMSCTIVR